MNSTAWLLLISAAVVYATRRRRVPTPRAPDARRAGDEAERTERAGRDGERIVARELAALPRGYVVLHDVRLVSNRWWRVRGGNAKTAQIDHLVVGPCGVVVVETKQWSAGFSSARTSWTASDQADRASDLCWRVLAQARLKCSVIGVVAYTGARPQEPDASRVRVRHVSDLVRTVRGLAHVASSQQVDAIAAFVRSSFACGGASPANSSECGTRARRTA